MSDIWEFRMTLCFMWTRCADYVYRIYGLEKPGDINTRNTIESF